MTKNLKLSRLIPLFCLLALALGVFPVSAQTTPTQEVCSTQANGLGTPEAECRTWCKITPRAQVAGLEKLRPFFSLQVTGPETMDWEPSNGEEYYVYYRGEYVNGGIIGLASYVSQVQTWGINTRWALEHPFWWVDSYWEIHYTMADGTCPFSTNE